MKSTEPSWGLEGGYTYVATGNIPHAPWFWFDDDQIMDSYLCMPHARAALLTTVMISRCSCSFKLVPRLFSSVCNIKELELGTEILARLYCMHIKVFDLRYEILRYICSRLDWLILIVAAFLEGWWLGRLICNSQVRNVHYLIEHGHNSQTNMCIKHMYTHACVHTKIFSACLAGGKYYIVLVRHRVSCTRQLYFNMDSGYVSCW